MYRGLFFSNNANWWSEAFSEETSMQVFSCEFYKIFKNYCLLNVSEQLILQGSDEPV